MRDSASARTLTQYVVEVVVVVVGVRGCAMDSSVHVNSRVVYIDRLSKARGSYGHGGFIIKSYQCETRVFPFFFFIKYGNFTN